MVFSIAPVIIIVLTVVGVVLGPDAVNGELHNQLKDFLGGRGARQIEKIIATIYDPDKTGLASVVAGVLLIVGSTSVFRQLRKSLNTIWEVKPQAKKAVVVYFLSHAFSLGMIICIALLLLVSLVVHAAITALSDFLTETFSSMSVWVISAFDHTLSLAASTVLFALVYKYLSDAKLQWRSVWEGAFFTAILFTIGKHLIGLYIGATHLATTYGAVGSAVMILVWVFYSSQLVFFGAQFTRALATQRGYSLDPSNIAPDVEGKQVKEQHENEKREA
jgi:membrane protein